MNDFLAGWTVLQGAAAQHAPLLWTAGIGYLLILNYTAYLLFKFDKAYATAQTRRVPEAILLGTAFWGGSLGAKLAQRRFRHKTRKQPFRSNLNAIVALHVIAFVVFAIWVAGLTPAILNVVSGLTPP